MRHRIGFNRLSRRPAHRKALKRNMVTSLLLEERITTTQTKALEVRRMAEKMVTRAREDSVHNRRMVARDIKDKKALAKLFTEIAPRFKDRAGGYTRVLKLGPRSGDAAEMVLLEFVERSGQTVAPPKKRAAPKKSETQKSETPVEAAGKKVEAKTARKPAKKKTDSEAGTVQAVAQTEEGEATTTDGK